MKRRIKLITTLATLGLTMCIMAFGVYSAIQISYSVTNSITYNVAQGIGVTVHAGAAIGTASLDAENKYSKAYNEDAATYDWEPTDMIFTVENKDSDCQMLMKITNSGPDGASALKVKITRAVTWPDWLTTPVIKMSLNSAEASTTVNDDAYFASTAAPGDTNYITVLITFKLASNFDFSYDRTSENNNINFTVNIDKA